MTLSIGLVENGKLAYTYDGKTVEIDVQDSGWQSLETVLHEVRHTWQDEVSSDRIEAEKGMKEAFEANGFTVSDVDGKKGIHYLNGENDFNLYLLNPTETDANIYAQSKVSGIIDEMRSDGVTDPAMDIYSRRIESNGYCKKLEGIKSLYGEDIDKQVETTLKNIYNKANEPVRQAVETAVKNEMIASYQSCLAKDSKLDAGTGKTGTETKEGSASEKWSISDEKKKIREFSITILRIFREQHLLLI